MLSGAFLVVLLDWTKTNEAGDVPPYGEGLAAGEELGLPEETRWHQEVHQGEGKRRGPQGGRCFRHHRLLATPAQDAAMA